MPSCLIVSSGGPVTVRTKSHAGLAHQTWCHKEVSPWTAGHACQWHWPRALVKFTPVSAPEVPLCGHLQGWEGECFFTQVSRLYQLPSRTAELCHTRHVFGDGRGSRPERKALRGSERLGRAKVLPTSHPSIPGEDTYPRLGAGTCSGHDRVLFYWEETSAQEVRCGRCWRREGDGVQSEMGTRACGPRMVEWGLSMDSKQQEACWCTCWLTDYHPWHVS